ncbi:alpha-tocopherol transfer protein-like [Phymastichus coffea]|uniref:alpha-tocopherol transfer protein-like n=1 Tax=Phymastichus coffea TaxID=108790 RepID=UPI00273AA304|nr:alpha-tocopherol transfer protein-like [Phymastichus coffea]
MKLGHDIKQSRTNWPSITNELLEELQTWATKHSLPKVPPEQLAIFAHSCYYDKPATIKCMETYYRLRATVPEFFENRDPTLDSLQFTLKVANYVCLPKPDKEGNRIVFHGLSDTNPRHYMFSDSVKLLMMTMDASLYEHGCVPGHVFLFDMKGVKITHLMRLSLTMVRRFFEYIQEAMPVRLKAIHVLNCVWFIDKVLALIKPFMKKELLDILHLHTGDVSEVYQYIPPECLPKDFGGKLDDVENLHAEQCQKLVELREYFEEEERSYRCYWPAGKSSHSKSDADGLAYGKEDDGGAEEAS